MTVAPGEVCPTCGTKAKAEHDGPPRPPRKKLTISIPPGEEGVLDDLLIQFVERFQPAWGEDAGGELVPVGANHWKYMGLHYALYALVTADQETMSRLLPAEIGA